MLLLLASPSLRAALAEISTATSSGEGGYGSAALDTIDGFGLFGSSTPFSIPLIVSSGAIVSEYCMPGLGLGNPFGYCGGVIDFAFSNFWNISAAVYDPTTDFGFFASSQAPAGIEAVPLGLSAPPGAVISSITLQSGQNWIGSAVIDTTNHFAYFGTMTSPSMVVKVQVPDGVSVTSMTVISSITLPAGLDYLSAAVIDVQNGFAYFGSSTTTGAVAKIQLSNFTLAGTLTFNSGEGAVASVVIDTTNQLAFFGTHDSPGKIVKVKLPGLTRMGALTLQTGQNDLTSAVIDLPERQLAYFGTNTSSGVVIPIFTIQFTEGVPLTLGAGQNFLRSAVIDTTNEYAYFGTYTTPGFAIQIDLLAGPPVITVQPQDSTVHAGETAGFSIGAVGRNLSYQWQRNGVNIPGATSSGYSFTTTSADDGTTFLCIVTNANGTVTSHTVQLIIIPTISVYPNPWRSDRPEDVKINFVGLLPNSTVKIFNLAVHWVKTLPVASGSTTWDLTNDQGQKVASGYYFYLITTGNDKQTVHGKLAIIR